MKIKKNRLLILIGILIIAFMGEISHANTDNRCTNNNIKEMTTRFTDNEDGTITDTLMQLIWQKCTFGQSYKQESCVGEPTLISWENKKKIFTYNSLWRLPTIQELEAIISKECSIPAINTLAFPNATSGFYWSKTLDKENIGNAYGVFFLYGEVGISDIKFKRYIRLVRDAE